MGQNSKWSPEVQKCLISYQPLLLAHRLTSCFIQGIGCSAASSSLKCYESVNNGLGDEVICKDSTSASILGDGDGPFKCATVTTS